MRHSLEIKLGNLSILSKYDHLTCEPEISLFLKILYINVSVIEAGSSNNVTSMQPVDAALVPYTHIYMMIRLPIDSLAFELQTPLKLQVHLLLVLFKMDIL